MSRRAALRGKQRFSSLGSLSRNREQDDRDQDEDDKQCAGEIEGSIRSGGLYSRRARRSRTQTVAHSAPSAERRNEIAWAIAARVALVWLSGFSIMKS
jgi:hypothetical protein